MRNNPGLAAVPRSAAWAKIASKFAGRAVAYQCHEGTGTTIADALGQGPTITIQGTLTNLWNNQGFLTPNGTDVISTETGPDTVIDSICDMTLLDGEQLLVAFDLSVTGNPASAEGILCWGENSTSSGWALGINGAGQVGLAIRGTGGGGSWDNDDISSFQVGSLSGRASYVCDIHGNRNATVDFDLYANGAAVGNSVTGKDLTGGGTAPPTGGDDRGLVLMCRNTATSTDRLLASATSGALLGRVLMLRRSWDPTNDSGLALALAQDLYRYPGEAPMCLLSSTWAA